MLINAARASAIALLSWLALPLGGTLVSVVSKVYLTPLSEILNLSSDLISPKFSLIKMISDSCSKSGIGSVGLEAEESNSLTETTVVRVA